MLRQALTLGAITVLVIALAGFSLFRPLPVRSTTPLQSPPPEGTPAYFPIVFKDWPPTATPDPRTPTPTRTLSPFNYTKTVDSPAYLPNFANSNGCAWHGISGQVFDLERKGILGLIVRVSGPNNFLADAISGSNQRYGASGYEITLGIAPIDSNEFRIQLRNGAGLALSDSIVVPTFAQCNKNHIIFNFEQNH